jgi:hypothetical protein
MITNCRELAGNMIIGDEIVRKKLNESTTIDYQTKILLRFITHTSLHMYSFLYRLSAFNMSLLNDMKQVIDYLPDQFYYIKIKSRNLVKSKEEHNYQWLVERIPDTSFECEGDGHGHREELKQIQQPHDLLFGAIVYMI